MNRLQDRTRTQHDTSGKAGTLPVGHLHLAQHGSVGPALDHVGPVPCCHGHTLALPQVTILQIQHALSEASLGISDVVDQDERYSRGGHPADTAVT